MKKIFVKFMSCMILGALILGVSVKSSAEASPCACSYCGVTLHVADASSFYSAVNNACADTIIELDNDIYLDSPATINFPGNIRKNGYRIIQKYSVEHPGYYTSEPVVTYEVVINQGYRTSVPVVTYQNVWHDGWTEVVCCDVLY